MSVAFFRGIALALGLILPLGVQNVIIINQEQQLGDYQKLYQPSSRQEYVTPF